MPCVIKIEEEMQNCNTWRDFKIPLRCSHLYVALLERTDREKGK